MSSFCLQSRTRPPLIGRRLHDPLDQGSSVSLSSVSLVTKNTGETSARRIRGDSGGASLAQTAVVPHLDVDGSGFSETSNFSSPAHSGQGQHIPSRVADAPSHGVEDIPEIKEILDKSRKDSTSLLYGYKWKSFLKFTQARGLPSSPVDLSTLLQFLCYLFDFKLSISTLKVYIAAIVSFQPRGSPASRLFSHTTVKAFLKGLAHLRPPVKPPLPQWSLHLVLQSLMRPPLNL